MNSLARAARSLLSQASTSTEITNTTLKGIPAVFTRSYHKNVSHVVGSFIHNLYLVNYFTDLFLSLPILQVVDHYERPRNVGSFDKNDPNVGTGLVGAPACGDVMKLQIKVDDDGNIVDSCFKTFGCGSAIASSSVATEWVKGKAVDEVLTIKNNDIAKHLSLPPVKLHCSMLAEDAIKAAVSDWKAKRAGKKEAATA